MNIKVIIIILLLLICAIIISCHNKTSIRLIKGGKPSLKNDQIRDFTGPHVVIDGLNVTHWIYGDVSPKLIIDMIDLTSPVLHQIYFGRIMYMIKDTSYKFNDEQTRNKYSDAAKRNKVYILIAEKYIDPPSGNKQSDKHSKEGRDDFYMAILASRYRCKIITNDNFKDFNEFRKTLQPFHVVEYTFWRDLPFKDYIRPESLAYIKLRRPRTIKNDEIFVSLFNKK